MDNFVVPLNIKKKILFNYFTTIFGGAILCIGCFIFEHFYLDKIIAYTDIVLFSNAFRVAMLCSLLFLVILPAILLIVRKDERKIEKSMKNFNLTDNMLSFDYDKAVSVGKIKIGEKCSYFKSMYSFTVLPHKEVAWVYVSTTVKKNKKVARSLDGDVLHEKYTMSENYQYTVVMQTITRKIYRVNCGKQKTAHDIINYFSKMDHVLLGEGKEQKKEYNRMVNAYKNGIKDYDKINSKDTDIRF
jgi:hypothetical protein